MMRVLFLAVALLSPAFICGCGGGPKLVSVTGKVLHNGQPLTAGSIVLHPAEGNDWQGADPSSVLQVDGSFSINTFPHGDGAPPGKYKVMLAPSLANRIGKPDHANPAKTPWTLEVPNEGVKDKVFEVK
jgi:hypothetical protein